MVANECKNEQSFSSFNNWDSFDISYYAQFLDHVFYDEYVSTSLDRVYSWAYEAEEFVYKSNLGRENYNLNRYVKTDCIIMEIFWRRSNNEMFGRIFYPDGGVYVGWAKYAGVKRSGLGIMYRDENTQKGRWYDD